MKKNIGYIIDFLRFHFVPKDKAWKPTWFILLGYSVLLLLIGFSVNFKNGKLEKVTGIVDDFKYEAIPENDRLFFDFNLKLEGDTTIYGQSYRSFEGWKANNTIEAQFKGQVQINSYAIYSENRSLTKIINRK